MSTSLIIAALVPLLSLLSGCTDAPTVRDVVRTATHPTSLTLGLTAPNLISGPIYNTPARGQTRPDANRTGVVGVVASLTWSLNPIKITRADPLPGPVVAPAPTPLPASDYGR